MAKRPGLLRDVWLGPSITKENEPECQLDVANTKGFACGLRASVCLGTGAWIGTGIGIWNGIGIILLDGVHKCARAGSCNASLGDTRGKTGRQGM